MSARRLIEVVLLFAVLAGLRLWAGHDFVTTGANGDPDSVMRLLQVRDWLGGQPWYDLHQYRIGGPGGVAMHWTRVGDLIPGGIVAVVTPVIGAPAAEHAALVATPIVLLAAAFALMLGIVRTLAGRPAPRATAVVFAMSLGAMTLFTPGDVDHHTIQLVLVLALLRAVVAPPGRASAVAAAAAAVMTMVVGIETAPVVVAVLATVGARWAWAPETDRGFVTSLGLALVGCSLAALVLFMPRPWIGACDAWTLPIFWLTTIAGLAFVAAGATTPSPRARHLVVPVLVVPVLVVLAGVIAVVTAYPACRVHPAGSDPLLWRYWMDTISENQRLHAMAAEQGWGAVIIVLGVAPIALLAGARAAWASQRWAWLPVLAATIAALAVTVLHVRGQALLGGVSACLAAALIVAALEQRGWRRTLGVTALLPLSWLVLGAALTRPPAPGAAATAVAAQPACRSPQVMAALNRLPVATLIVPMMVEPHVLAATHHRSLGATYHRNTAGNHAMIAALIAPPDLARLRLHADDVSYLLYCPGYDFDRYAREQPASLTHAVVADRAPAWLVPIARPIDGVRLYAVR